MRATRGFTLLELLAASAIAVVLVGLILTVMSTALGLWRRGQGDVAVAADAGTVLAMLERDLESAGPAHGGEAWLAVDLAPGTGELGNRGWVRGARMKPGGETSLRPLPPARPGTGADLTDARFGLSGARLRLLTVTAESSAEPALPRVVAWQIARRPVTGPVTPANPAPVRYVLFRSAIGAEETFLRGADVTAPAWASSAEAPAGTRAPSTIANPAVSDAVITNVIDFGVWLHRRAQTGKLERIFPTDAHDVAHAAAAEAGGWPDTVDVLLRVLSEEGARQLELIETGRLARPPAYAADDAWWWAVAEENSRVMVRRVELKGARP